MLLRLELFEILLLLFLFTWQLSHQENQYPVLIVWLIAPRSLSSTTIYTHRIKSQIHPHQLSAISQFFFCTSSVIHHCHKRGFEQSAAFQHLQYSLQCHQITNTKSNPYSKYNHKPRVTISLPILIKGTMWGSEERCGNYY